MCFLVAQLVKNPPAMRETWLGKIPWKRERLPTPVFWPGEFHGLYSSWGYKELDTTEWLSLSCWLFFLCLLCWGMFPLYPFHETFYHKWMLTFVKCFFCITWGDHVVFVFPFADVVSHKDWLAYVEPSLRHWNEFSIITVHDPFYTLLDSVSSYLAKDICIYIHQRIGLVLILT